MDVPLSEAGPELVNLVRRAEAGEDIVLTRDGEPVIRFQAFPLKPEWSKLTPQERMARIKAALAKLPPIPDDGVSAARSQDFLYDEFGLPK